MFSDQLEAWRKTKPHQRQELERFENTKQIKPGLKTDFIKIPVYQGDYGSEGSRAIYNEHVYDVIITGEQLPALLPKAAMLI